MSAEPSRARIDQFFTSRKRKNLLPKNENSDKESRSPAVGSPSGKSTLDGFLSKSPKGTALASICEADDSSPRHELVKRNLTSETGSGSDASRKLAFNSCAGNGCAKENRPRDHLDSAQCLSIAVVTEREKDSSEAVPSHETPSEGNLELKKFAADFLSLYCSDVQSAVSLPSEPEQKGQKRNVSPSYLAACSKVLTKRQCPLEASHNSPEPPTCRSQAIAENEEVKEVKLKISGGKKLNSEINVGVSLRRCSATPIASNTNVRHCREGRPCNTEGPSGTPKSAVRNSMFSPGEEFWCEAIQVADCLLPAVTKPSNLPCSRNEISDNKLVADGSSFMVPQNKNVLNGIGEMTSKNCSKTFEKILPENITALRLNQTNSVSPLPVKHFDFSHEDGLQQCVAEKTKVSIIFSIQAANDNGVNHEFLHHSPDPEQEKDISSVPNGSSYANENSCQTGADCNLAVSKGKCVSSTHDNSSPSGNAHDSSKKEETNQKVSVSDGNHKGSGTPSSFMLPKYSLQLHSWLPSEVCSIYMKKSISKLYPWQVECLLVDGVLEGRNLVYCATTSSGKSFVAEILMLRQVLSSGKMALLVLPYVSLCAEKAEHLELLLEPFGKHVRSFYGNQGGGALPKDTSVAVCTIEKANSLINRLLEESRLSELGIIVIDELHMVADQHRGYLLELLLTKLRYAAGEGSTDSSSGERSGGSSGEGGSAHGLQIVGMSATMPNVAAVADWLQAALYQTEFRPVPLEEFIKVGNTIFDKKMKVVRTIPKTSDLAGRDPDHIVEMCNEVVQEGHSVLLFCSSRKGCESTARHVARFLKKISVDAHEGCEFNDVSSAIEALRRSPGGLDPILEQTLPSGVAYHHAGLTVEEREIIETCYRKGLVRILTATSTLAAGVNLPARRVIFRQPRIGRDFIDGTRYRQMAGRAGRTGIDTRGESILICKADEVKKVTAIINDGCPPLHSCLSEDKNGMTHAIMEVVAGGIVQTAHDINRYVRCTLLNSTKPFQDVVKSAQDSLRWLCNKKFLQWTEDTKLYNTTPLGRAAFGSSLTPEESLIVLDDLLKAREAFVLASDLHLVYLVTPINVDVEPDWELYYERFMELPSLEQSVGDRVGVTEPFLMRMAHGASFPAQNRTRGKKSAFSEKLRTRNVVSDNSLSSDERTLRVSRRFYVALMLSRLVQEVPVSDVCEAFKVARGMIQALQENAGRFAAMISVFCERLGWQDLQGLFAKFQNRVSFGVRAEIAELTAIPYIKGSRARALYKAGLRTPLAIAEASVTDIVIALSDSSRWASQDESNLQRRQLGIAKKIKNGARKIILDQAEEARIAAFSAFKSLGVHVPQLSRPLLSTVAEEFVEGSKLACSKDEPIKDVQLTEMRLADHHREPSIETNNSSLKAAGVDDNGNASRILIKNETVGHPNPMVDVPVMSDQGIMVGLKEDNHGTTPDGPIPASNFPGGFDFFLDQWASVNEFYFDLHFLKRQNPNSSILFEVLGLAISWENSPVYYCNFSKDLVTYSNVNEFDMWDLARNRWSKIAKIMRQDGVGKITWNLKIQIQALKSPCVSIQRCGKLNFGNVKWDESEIIDNSFLSLPNIFVHNGVDLCLANWILWPDEESKSTPNLEKVVKKRLPSHVSAAANRDGRWKNQMRKAAHNGCCRRVAQIRALSSFLLKLIASEGLAEVLSKIEYPLVEVLADMELWGIGVDMEMCLHHRHILIRKLKELEKEAYRLAGITFSLYNAADIANVLYTHLKLPIPQESAKGKLHPSTAKHSLDQLRDQHPIISVIKEHRTLSKLLNSTLGSVCSRAQLCMKSQKYKIHGHWLQASTATGRLAMEEPNLQCVEHTVAFTTHQTDQFSSSSIVCNHQINARDIFVPSEDDWLLLTADYSQIELRLMAHFSKDLPLIELLSKPDGDVFIMMASRWTSKPESSINSDERDCTKRLVYGILYGMGPNALGEQLQCSPEEAAEKIQSFRYSFPGISTWLDEAVSSCRQKGYIKTLMGRKRFLSKIKFGNHKEKAKAQRQAVNSICQGSAADIVKVAMLNVHSAIVDGRSNFNGINAEYPNLKGHCRIILQVHDELVLEVERGLIKAAGNFLQSCMENAASLLVPLRVKLKFGKTWGSLKPLQLEP
ncbi:helicase and polymerase-containing protein TEBICHI-like [Zingiber officinale]|uniref:helicase and polymerase-containing protein TEBICHI-like n=1 Tax=Zingiber officinale TaxID=94328 RepID=UPI001C4B102C|nr:helicase and polymerase-containing protein TEBICHI-like [Zingiber officinale]